MTNWIEAIKEMSDRVAINQDCVLEVIIGEDGLLAHLIPQELWTDEYDEEDKDD